MVALPPSLLNHAAFHLRFQRERKRVAEVAVSEAVQEAKSRDSIEAFGRFRDADRADVADKAEERNLDGDEINGKRTRVGALERDRLHGKSPAQDAVVFI